MRAAVTLADADVYHAGRYAYVLLNASGNLRAVYASEVHVSNKACVQARET